MIAAAAKVALFLPGDGSPWLWHLNSERPFIKVTRRHRHRRLPPSHSLLSQRVGLGELGRRASVRPSAQPGAAAAGTTAVRTESTERPPEGAAPAWIEGQSLQISFLGTFGTLGRKSIRSVPFLGSPHQHFFPRHGSQKE